MTISKKIRQEVYNKYDGHCAYCGKSIEYKDMQVDHLIPQMMLKHHWQKEDIVENINNYMPSCRRCNSYKRASSLKRYRELIETVTDRLMDKYIFKVAVDYNLVHVDKRHIKFYFEECEDKKK